MIYYHHWRDSTMHGGLRDGAGRKVCKDKKYPVTIYLNESERQQIDNIPMPDCQSFSKKCRKLLALGAENLTKNLKTHTDEIKYIDLFCGLGGIRLGFEKALYELGLKGSCVFSSDIKKSAISAYLNYFGDNPECDITKVNPSQLPNFDFLLGGFPCQAFSQAGLGRGFQDTRGTLFFNVAKILLEKKPLGFILENVEGLVTHDKGNTYKVIMRTLQDIGYSVEAKVLNGKDFGLAQSRNRIYFIGLLNKPAPILTGFTQTKSKLKDILDPTAPIDQSIFSQKLLKHFKLTEIYGKAIKDKRGGKNNIHSWDIELKGKINQDQRNLLELLLKYRRNKKWASAIGIDWMDGMPLTAEMISTFFPHKKLLYLLDDLVEKGYLVLEYPKSLVNNRRVENTSLKKGYNIVTGKLSFKFTKILDPESVTPTLVATDVHKLAVPVSGGIRSLTIREGLRLFGFPEDYSLDYLKESEAFDLLGNTVCIPVITAISRKLLIAARE